MRLAREFITAVQGRGSCAWQELRQSNNWNRIEVAGLAMFAASLADNVESSGPNVSIAVAIEKE